MIEAAHRVLMVDDDGEVLRAYVRSLRRQGLTIESASDGQSAIERMRREPFDAIISDIAMPGMGGLDFLQAVREQDPDLPVILMTGLPGLESARRAVEYGAFRYLLKPVSAVELEQAVRLAVNMHDAAKARQQAVALESLRQQDRTRLEEQFQAALDGLWMAYQPIVTLSGKRCFGYEALLRSVAPGMTFPGPIIEAAERLGKVADLGRAIRARVATDAARAPSDSLLFINLHAIDLNDASLYAPDAPLSAHASRVVLEITERASLDDVHDLKPKLKTLRGLGFRIAVDDLGAGYAGLTSYSTLEPDIAKIDMSLVQGIDTQTRNHSIVRSLKRLSEELGTQVIVEGVETTGERAALEAIGCDLFQGYLFARPDRNFVSPRF